MAETCVVVPAVAGVVGVPAYTEIAPSYGWDSGANSVVSLAGDVRVASDMDKVIGVIWGFTQAREANPSKDRITHGFYFSQTSGQPQYQVIESGKALTEPQWYAVLSDVFEVRRIGAGVAYVVNDVLVYTSRVALGGEVSVASALYATGDGVP